MEANELISSHLLAQKNTLEIGQEMTELLLLEELYPY